LQYPCRELYLLGNNSPMYALIRHLLFLLDAEVSHNLSLDLLGAAERLKLLPLFSSPDIADPVELMGLTFPNPVGLAAGLDKNGDYFNALGQLGFGFVEIGTVTPKPQQGNPKPRLFRLPEHNAIINRMGFNNRGVDYLLEQVKQRRYGGILGINIGKNKTTPEEDALSDYTLAMQKVYCLADYITVNISSPNTPGLRQLQFGDPLNRLLEGLKETQRELADTTGRYVPVVLKIAPDMDPDDIQSIAHSLLRFDIDGVIATNTTIGRNAVADSPLADEMGGLSGAPLTDLSTQVVTQLRAALGEAFPIIGVGGINQGIDAAEKIAAGANLVQIYSGFIYHGPQLIKNAREAIIDSRR